VHSGVGASVSSARRGSLLGKSDRAEVATTLDDGERTRTQFRGECGGLWIERQSCIACDSSFVGAIHPEHILLGGKSEKRIAVRSML